MRLVHHESPDRQEVRQALRRAIDATSQLFDAVNRLEAVSRADIRVLRFLEELSGADIPHNIGGGNCWWATVADIPDEELDAFIEQYLKPAQA